MGADKDMSTRAMTDLVDNCFFLAQVMRGKTALGG